MKPIQTIAFCEKYEILTFILTRHLKFFENETLKSYKTKNLNIINMKKKLKII
jgi:hypothetical protein